MSEHDYMSDQHSLKVITLSRELSHLYSHVHVINISENITRQLLGRNERIGVGMLRFMLQILF